MRQKTKKCAENPSRRREKLNKKKKKQKNAKKYLLNLEDGSKNTS